ncbi:MAG: DUF4438 domain-containing protein [Candidatus Bathyarchaeota archaeon]|nr:DUF4438 domain-containing protein [Candidatus Bathyarchaeota archaeon]
MVAISTNRDKLMRQALLGKIAPPKMLVEGGLIGGYVTTWDGRPKIGIGVGGIKYNVGVGDPCLGWAEAEYLEPGVSLLGVDDRAEMAFVKLSCVGNEATVVDGEAKGARGVVTGKGGTAATAGHVFAHFPEADLEGLNIGDKVRVTAEGVGLEIEGFDGRVFNMSPGFLESLGPEIDDGMLRLPAVKEVPSHAMGMGVGGAPAESGSWCIQFSPPRLVEELGLGGLRIGDLVACRDILMSYGKGYYRGAMTIGVVTTGGSDIAGHGPGVMAIAASKKGKIEPRIDPGANVTRYLGLEA